MKRLIAFIIATILLYGSVSFADSYDDMLQKAATYFETGDIERAGASYKLAQKIDVQREDAYLGEVELLYITERYDEAIDVLDIVFSINALSQPAWTLKCLIDVAKGDISAYEEDSLYAEVCGVDLSQQAADIAVMYAEAGKYSDAANYFSKADSLTEEQQELYHRALMFTGELEQANEPGLLEDYVRNAKLDTAFASDNLVLKKVAIPEIRIEDFEFTDDVWNATDIMKPADLQGELETSLKDADVKLISLSTAGNTGIFSIGGAWVGLYNGKLHVLYPSSRKGVADTNENLKFYFQYMPDNKLLGEEGVVYSKDGRYAAVNNTRITLVNANYFIDPIIIDLSTGELILTATYGNWPFRGSAGVVTTGIFSNDGQYYYYILFGSTTEDRCALYRYNLIEGETELCCSIPYSTYYPYLSEISEGKFIIVEDQINASEKQSIIQLELINDTWKIERFEFSTECKYWYASKLFNSLNSGYALIPGVQRALQASIAFMFIKPNEGYEGLNTYYAIDRSAMQLVPITMEEYIESIQSAYNTKARNIDTGLLPYFCIQKAILSPDGYYVLMLTNNEKDRTRLLLASLETMEVKEVQGIKAAQILAASASSRFYPIIEWNTNTLILCDEEGISAYQFDFD